MEVTIHEDFSSLFDHARWMAQAHHFEEIFIFFIQREDKLEAKAVMLKEMTNVQQYLSSLITPRHGVIIPCTMSTRKGILMQIFQRNTLLYSIVSYEDMGYATIENTQILSVMVDNMSTQCAI